MRVERLWESQEQVRNFAKTWGPLTQDSAIGTHRKMTSKHRQLQEADTNYHRSTTPPRPRKGPGTMLPKDPFPTAHPLGAELGNETTSNQVSTYLASLGFMGFPMIPTIPTRAASLGFTGFPKSFHKIGKLPAAQALSPFRVKLASVDRDRVGWRGPRSVQKDKGVDVPNRSIQ